MQLPSPLCDSSCPFASVLRSVIFIVVISGRPAMSEPNGSINSDWPAVFAPACFSLSALISKSFQSNPASGLSRSSLGLEVYISRNEGSN